MLINEMLIKKFKCIQFKIILTIEFLFQNAQKIRPDMVIVLFCRLHDQYRCLECGLRVRGTHARTTNFPWGLRRGPTRRNHQGNL